MSAATMTCSPQMVLARGGVASTSSRVAAGRHAPSCMMFSVPRRMNTVPMQSFRGQGCRQRPNNGQQCRSGFASGTYGPFMWGSGGMNGGFNPKAWEPLLRMWGLQPDSPRWQEMMRDLERGQAPWGTVNQVVEDVAAAIALPVDVEESEDAYAFIADVPGLEKGDIKIRVNQEERQLIISGERRRPNLAGAGSGRNADAGASEQERSSTQRRKSERRFGKFERKLGKLPEDADLDAVTARVEKGVLTVWIRKAEGARPNIKDVFID